MAALDPNSAIGQVEVANSKLSEYFSLLNKYLVDTTGTVALPDFATFVDKLDYSELLRMSTTRAKDSASYENGAAIENIEHMASIIREFSLRRKSKINYYSDAGTEIFNESNFYSTLSVFWVSMMNGNYIEGATS